jgi:hypothetical protein
MGEKQMTLLERLTQRYQQRKVELVTLTAKESQYPISSWKDQINMLKGECKGLLFAIDAIKDARQSEMEMGAG